MQLIQPFIKAAIIATLLFSATVGCSSLKVSEKQPTKFGALAIDRNNGFYYGWAYDQNSLVDAEQKAINECNNRGGKGTVVLEWSGRGCAAYRTTEGTIGTAYGWGLAATKEEADVIATKNCLKRSNGIPADNLVWACNSGAVNSLKEIFNETQEPLQNNPTAGSEFNDFISFNGNNLAASGSCPDSGVAMLAADDETVMVLFNNVPPDGTTSVNADFFTNECSSCFGISIQDLNASLTYVATAGTFTKKGNEISFTIAVKELSSLIEGSGSSFPVTGKFICEE
ncbi:MAG: DUF4189 domain-containing protein [Flavobacterium sp.]|nr:DUF4189 domain-containing protein [Flavobacterium sp.]